MDDPELSANSFAFQCYLCLSKTELRAILPDIFENIASVILVYATLGCYIDTLDNRDWAVLSLQISSTSSYQSLLCRSISQQLLDWPELKIGPQWGEKLSRSINAACQIRIGQDNQTEALQVWRILCQRGIVANTAEARYKASMTLLKITRATTEACMRFRDTPFGWIRVIPETMDTLTIVFEFAQRLMDEYGSSDGRTCESVRQDILDAIEGPRYYEVAILQNYIMLVNVIRFPSLLPFMATFIDFMGADKIPQLRRECIRPLRSLVQGIADGKQDKDLVAICFGIALVYASLVPFYAQTSLLTEGQDNGESSGFFDGVSKFLEVVSKKDLSNSLNALLQIDRLKALVRQLLPIIEI